MAIIHRWKFDEGSGNAADTGTVGGLTGFPNTGASWITGRAGLPAIRFDGSAQGEVTFSSTDIGTATHSHGFWINYTDSGDGVIMSASSYLSYIDGPSAGGNIYININSHFVGVVHGGLTSGTWYRLVTTRSSNSTVRFYKNGVQIGTDQAFPFISTPIIATIGCQTDGSFPTACDLQDIKIWDVELTAQDVLDEYNAYFSTPLAVSLPADDWSNGLA